MRPTEEVKKAIPKKAICTGPCIPHDHIPNVYDALIAHPNKYKKGKVSASMLTQPYPTYDDIVYHLPWYILEYEGEGSLVPPYIQYYRTHVPTMQEYLRSHPNMTRKGRVYASDVYAPVAHFEEYFERFAEVFNLIFQNFKLDSEYLKEMEYLGTLERDKYLRGNSYPDEKILPKWAREVDDWDKFDKAHQEAPAVTKEPEPKPEKKGLKQFFQRKDPSERKHPIKDMISKIKNKKAEQSAGIGV